MRLHSALLLSVCAALHCALGDSSTERMRAEVTADGSQAQQTAEMAEQEMQARAGMAKEMSDALTIADGWRPLSDYYRPTGADAVYAGLAVPLNRGTKTIGVFSLDFGRETPWHAYSGFAVEELYQTLSNLITSYLAMLPP